MLPMPFHNNLIKYFIDIDMDMDGFVSDTEKETLEQWIVNTANCEPLSNN